MAAAVATLSESTPGAMAMRTRRSAAARAPADRPVALGADEQGPAGRAAAAVAQVVGRSVTG